MDELQTLREVLRNTLKLGSLADGLTAQSRLLGALPGLDSLSVVAVLAAIEKKYAVRIRNDELSADVFATLGRLNAFIQHKVHESKSGNEVL